MPNQKSQTLFSTDTTKMEIEKFGYLILKGCSGAEKINKAREQLRSNIRKCSKELNLQEKQYLSVLTRWVSPSPITEGILNPFKESLEQIMTEILGSEVALQKWNVICKNPYNTHSIPLHQDISYSPDNSYQFSAWLALNDVEHNCGPLRIIPKSHLDPIEKAVDFWSPGYHPDTKKENSALSIPIKAGDIIVFDARLWHGSSPNTVGANRFALVTRWSTKGWFCKEQIPPIEPMKFGMWTAGDQTKRILQNGIQIIMQEKLYDYKEVIDAWIAWLETKILPINCDVKSAIAALKQVRILNLGYEQHNGGDATGRIYKNLWKSLLYELQNYLSAPSYKEEV